MNGSEVKYRLEAGSSLLRPATWERMERDALKALIQRFATRESKCSKKAEPTFRWRRKRLAAIAVFERRFGPAPELFTRHKLPKLKSYYVLNGKYLWPGLLAHAAQQGASGDVGANAPPRLS